MPGVKKEVLEQLGPQINHTPTMPELTPPSATLTPSPTVESAFMPTPTPAVNLEAEKTLTPPKNSFMDAVLDSVADILDQKRDVKPTPDAQTMPVPQDEKNLAADKQNDILTVTPTPRPEPTPEKDKKEEKEQQQEEDAAKKKQKEQELVKQQIEEKQAKQIVSEAVDIHGIAVGATRQNGSFTTEQTLDTTIKQVTPTVSAIVAPQPDAEKPNEPQVEQRTAEQKQQQQRETLSQAAEVGLTLLASVDKTPTRADGMLANASQPVEHAVEKVISGMKLGS